MKLVMQQLSETQTALAEATAAHRSKIAELEAKIGELTPLAAYGKKYHVRLVEDFLRYRKSLGEASDEGIKNAYEKAPIDLLISEVAVLEKRVAGRALKPTESRPLSPVFQKMERQQERSTSPLRPKRRV